MQPATTATDPESRPLTVLTQKPPFSTGNNLCLLTSAATLEAALQEAHLKMGIGPTGSITACSRFPHRWISQPGASAVDAPMHSSLGSCRSRRRADLRNLPAALAYSG